MSDDSGKPNPLDDLAARLSAARAARGGGKQRETRAEAGPGMGAGSGAGLGARMGVELVAGIAAGSLIGFGLDSWLGTKPWLMVVFFFLGAAASVVNMYRAAQGLDESVGLGQAARRKRQQMPRDDNKA